MNLNHRTLELLNDKRSWHVWANRLWLACGAAILLALLMPWMQTIRGMGKVMALNPQDRRQELSAPLEGRIQKWHVSEGQSVKKGDLIVELTDNDPEIIERINRERNALEKKFESIEVARKTAYINVKRQKELFEQGLSSRRQYELAQMELAKFESEEAASLAELSRVDVRLSRQEQQKITAPTDGTIVRILKTSGGGVEYVNAGEPLAVLVPNTSARAVEIWVSGNDMPWVYENHKVALNFEGWPAVFFSGIPYTSVGTFFGRVATIDAIDDGHGNFRIVIVPENDSDWPPAEHLRQGVRASAWVLLGDVPLGYEVWRQFNGFPPQNLPIYKKMEARK